MHYIAAEKVISLANQVFGFNGWSSGIKEVMVDFLDENPSTGRINLGLSVIVRVTLKDGAFHEDIGYGQIENCKGKAAAFEKAKKEGTTDALKRTLRNFGNVLGNCLYDKEYLSKVTRIKSAPARWDVDNLHRHGTFAQETPAPKVEPAPPVPAPGNAQPVPPMPARVVEPTSSKTTTDTVQGMYCSELFESPSQCLKAAATAFDADELDGKPFLTECEALLTVVVAMDFDETDFGIADRGNPDEVALEAAAGLAANANGNVASLQQPGMKIDLTHASTTQAETPNLGQPPARGPASAAPNANSAVQRPTYHPPPNKYSDRPPPAPYSAQNQPLPPPAPQIGANPPSPPPPNDQQLFSRPPQSANLNSNVNSYKSAPNPAAQNQGPPSLPNVPTAAQHTNNLGAPKPQFVNGSLQHRASAARVSNPPGQQASAARAPNRPTGNDRPQAQSSAVREGVHPAPQANGARVSPRPNAHQAQPQQGPAYNNGQDTRENDAAPPQPGQPVQGQSTGFYSARVAEHINNAAKEGSGPTLPAHVGVFNPRAESPSIPRTAGVDHTTSKHIGRDKEGGTVVNVVPPQPPRESIVNPQTNQHRKIGAPGGMTSPLANRPQFRVPAMRKRPAEEELVE